MRTIQIKVNASQVIWEFFNKYDINGLIETNSNIQELKIEKKKLKSIDLLEEKAPTKISTTHL